MLLEHGVLLATKDRRTASSAAAGGGHSALAAKLRQGSAASNAAEIARKKRHAERILQERAANPLPQMSKEQRDAMLGVVPGRSATPPTRDERICLASINQQMCCANKQCGWNGARCARLQDVYDKCGRKKGSAARHATVPPLLLPNSAPVASLSVSWPSRLI